MKVRLANSGPLPQAALTSPLLARLAGGVFRVALGFQFRFGRLRNGGGFGGCVIALVEADGAAAVTASVREAFAQRGWAEPVVFPGTPSDGAGRLA